MTTELPTPTYRQAIAAGVRDRSYSTVRFGHVESYSGQGVVEMPDGRRFLCVGHEATGSADFVSGYGYIDDILLDD